MFGSFYGLTCLVYFIIFENSVFYEYTLINYISAFVTGILISVGIVFINVACDMGNPGICNAIMNC